VSSGRQGYLLAVIGPFHVQGMDILPRKLALSRSRARGRVCGDGSQKIFVPPPGHAQLVENPAEPVRILPEMYW